MSVPFSRFLNPSRNPLLCFSRSGYNTWAAAIRNASSPEKALSIYYHMHRRNTPFDSFSILFTLKSCAPLHNLTLIRHLHSHILKLGFNAHVYVATCLLNSYVVTSFQDACILFDEMPERNTITWNSMITGYSRSGNVHKARCIFDEMPDRDVASWSAVITAYVNNGLCDQGLLIFQEMITRGEQKPDQITVGSVLSGCAHMGAVGLLVGKSVHGFTVKNGWEVNMEIGTVLVDFYAKCGSLKSACRVFDLMRERNIMTWTALICGAAMHGYSEEALSFFRMMQEFGVRPNEMTFTGILNACAHTGLVDEGREYFRMMIEEYGLEPRIQHYGCLVDLYGKAGFLEEAYNIIRSMKFEPNVVIWGSFLSACKEHKQFEMAERVVEGVLKEIRPENDGGVYSLISDLYVLNEKWDDAERIRKLMLNENVRKARGSSFIRNGK